MSYIIKDVIDFDEFWKHMPVQYKEQDYQMDVHYDVTNNKLIPIYFETVDSFGNSLELTENWFPPEFEESILNACKKVYDYIQKNEESDPFTYEDYLAERADKYEDEYKERYNF